VNNIDTQMINRRLALCNSIYAMNGFEPTYSLSVAEKCPYISVMSSKLVIKRIM
jgi:hypothetical protein